VYGKLRRRFFYPVKPVAQATRDGSADGVGLVGVDLDQGHVGQGQPCLGQSLRARGGIAAPGEIGVDPIAEFDSTWADPPQVKTRRSRSPTAWDAARKRIRSRPPSVLRPRGTACVAPARQRLPR
jgi:hypothetical protein